MTELWELENEIYAEGFSLICGVDEAGRGPLAGPVYAAFTHIDDISHGGIGRPHEGDKGRGHKDKERYRAERAAGFPVGRCRERKQDGKDEAVYEPAESFKANFPEHITRLLIFS